MIRLEWRFLGKVRYQVALELQYSYAQRVARGESGRLFLLEHPPTITLGRQASPQNLCLSEIEYKKRGIEICHVLRGGDVTYHGPGQLVGYPVANRRAANCSVYKWVKSYALAIIRFLANYGIDASWEEKHPGVWVGQRKICALGFHFCRGISTHGFALNLAPDLSNFATIVPCGLDGFGTTSMAQLGVSVPSMHVAAQEVAEAIAEVFGWELTPFVSNRERMFAER